MVLEARHGADGCNPVWSRKLSLQALLSPGRWPLVPAIGSTLEPTMRIDPNSGGWPLWAMILRTRQMPREFIERMKS
jgi:hypothetical protein